MMSDRPLLARAAAVVCESVRRMLHVCAALTLAASLLSLVSYALPHAEAQAETTFRPFTTVLSSNTSLPYVDAGGSNALAIREVVIAYTPLPVTSERPGDPPTSVTTNPEGCTTGAVDRVPLATTGDATDGGAFDTAAFSPVTLIDSPDGTTERCTYVANIGYISDAAGVFGPTANNAKFTAADAASVDVRYESVPATYNPAVDIGVPQFDNDDGDNVFAGATFDLTFVPLPVVPMAAGCAIAVKTYGVHSTGAVVPLDATDPETTPGAHPELTTVPIGGTQPCKYLVDYPSPVSTGYGPLAFRRVPTSDVPFAVNHQGIRVWHVENDGLDPFTDMLDPATTARYERELTVAITVPFVDDDSTAGNDLAGEFTVTYTRTERSSEMCFGSATETYTIESSESEAGSGVGVVAAPTGTDRFLLAHRPEAGAAERCEYTVDFPPLGGGAAPYVASPGRVTFAGGGLLATEYVAGFTPTISIVVPQYDGDDSADNAFEGTTFDVSFVPVGATEVRDDGLLLPGFVAGDGSGTACTTVLDKRYVVDAEGAVVPADGSDVVLAAMAAGSTDECVYAVEFPDQSSGRTLTQYLPISVVDGVEVVDASERDASLQASDPTAGTRYIAAQTTFEPTVTINVPFVDENSDNANDLQSGNGFNVWYRPASATNPSGCSSARSTSAWIQDGGNADDGGVVSHGPPDLVDRPVGSDERCRYVIDVPDTVTRNSIDLLVNPADDLSEVNGGVRAVTIDYALAPHDSFQPDITLSVPPMTDGRGATPVNLFDGAQFEVTFAQKSGVGPADGCSDEVTRVYTVNDDGTNEAPVTGTAPRLVDKPEATSDACVYVMTVPATVSTEADADVQWTLAVSANQLDVSMSADTHTADYVPDASGVAFLAPNPTVPQYNGDDDPDTAEDESEANAFAGLTFDVIFTEQTPATAVCDDSVTETYLVNDDGSVSPQDGTRPRLTSTGAGSQTIRCVYDVALAAPVTVPATPFAAATTLTLASGLAISLGAAFPEIALDTASDTTFSPNVEFSVPFIDDDGAAGNDLSGDTIAVTYAPVARTDGVTCSAAVIETYTIGDDGDAAAGGVVSGPAAAATLIDGPAGTNARCVYEADFDAQLSTTVPGTYGLILLGDYTLANDGDVLFNAVEPSPIAVAYIDEVATTMRTFEPDVTINVPQFNADDDDLSTTGVDESMQNAFTGETFTVRFAPASSTPAEITDCSASTDAVFEVQSDGSVATQSGNPVALVDRPLSLLTHRCAYEVTYPPTVAAATSTLTRQVADLDAETSNIDEAARATGATYHAANISFQPDVTITVPFVDTAAPSGENDLAGDITVTYASTGAGCSDGVTETYAVGIAAHATDGTLGVVTGPATAADLIDRPSGVDDRRCEYAASFSALAGPPLHAAVDDDIVFGKGTAAGTSIETSYSGQASFTPTINITVPDYNRDAPETGNWFAGAAFAVSFSLKTADSPADGCTDTFTPAAFTVQADRSVTGVAPTLVDTVEGAVGRCVYVVTFKQDVPADATATPAWNLSLVSPQTTTAEVHASDPGTSDTVTRDYEGVTYFAPNMTVTVPFVDDGSGGSSIDGQEASVVYAGADDCVVVGSPETYRVESDEGIAGGVQTLALVGDAARLVDRAAGVTARCSYEAAFSEPTAHMLAELPALVKPADITALDATTEATGTYALNTVDDSFTPTFAIELPGYAAADPANNVFADLAVPLAFANVAGSGDAPSSACTDAAALGTVTYVITAGGGLEPEGGGAAPTFTGVPGGHLLACRYTVTYPESTTSGETPPLLELVNRDAASRVAQFAAGSAATVPTYAGITRFTPRRATITVPFVDGDGDSGNDLAGPITVTYRSAGSGCTSTATETYTVGAAADAVDSMLGTVTGPTTPAILVDRPEGRDVPCAYVADFAAIDGPPRHGPAINGVTFDAGDTAAVATTYVAGITAIVEISVPQYSRDGEANVNFFAGAQIGVTVARSGGPETGCTPDTAEPVVFIVNADGDAVGALPTLIDVPDSETDSCAYTVTFADTVDSAAGVEPAWQLIGQGDMTAEVSAAAATLGRITVSRDYHAVSFFTPTDITVDVPFVDTTPADDRHDLAGQVGTVTFTPAAGASGDCTDQATATYTIDADASADDPTRATLTATLPQLVDRPEGDDERCAYVADFGDSIGAARVDVATNGQTVSAGDHEITVAYTYSPPAPPPPTGTTGGRQPSTGSGSRRPATGGGGGGGTRAPREPVNTETVVIDGNTFSETTSRAEVAVTLPSVPPGTFTSTESFEVMVSSPGACADDLRLFGGLSAGVGVVYAFDANTSGSQPVITSDAAARIPTHGGEAQQPCVVRLTVIKAPAGCPLTDAQTDADGRLYRERSLSSRPSTASVAAAFDCTARLAPPEPPESQAEAPTAASIAVAALPRG